MQDYKVRLRQGGNMFSWIQIDANDLAKRRADQTAVSASNGRKPAE